MFFESPDGRPTRRVAVSIAAAVTLAVSIAAIGAATAKKRPTERVGTIAFVSDRTGEDEIHLLPPGACAG